MNSDMEGMMDCVKKAFFEGCQRGDEFQKMRHAIIVELKRLGLDSSEIKDKLLEWNDRCERPLGLSEQKSQLFKYVDWVLKLKEPKVGCRGMESCGYCLGRENCNFYKNKYHKQREIITELPFDWMIVKKFVEERFKSHSYALLLVLDVLIWYQQVEIREQVIFIGYRKISSLIRDKYNHNFQPMTVKRYIQTLIDEGIVEVAEKGQSGQFK